LARKQDQQWSYENSAIGVSWLVQEAVEYGAPLDAAVRVLLNAAAAARSDNWQMFRITVEKLYQLPTPRLMTNSYGWTNLEEFGSFVARMPLSTIPHLRRDLTPMQAPSTSA
jgi:hypothetical protein